jgi:hypothetical protein
VAVTGGTAPLAFNIVSPGTGTLPPGLTLNPGTGTIAGTPTATGTFPFTVRVADSFGQQDTQALSITINSFNSPNITTTLLPAGSVGAVYGPATLQATGGIGTLTWSVSVGSLPPGLAIGPPSTGPSVNISGTPTTAGTSNFTVRVIDSLGQTATRDLSIQINAAAPPPNPPVILTTTTLPAGLTLGQGTGAITGTPTAAGTSNFTVQVQDAGGLLDTQDLSITIN